MLYQPDEPEIPTALAHKVSGTHPIKELDLPLFTIQTVPGKGKGLIARINIAQGTRILSEKPLFTTPNLAPITLMESTIATKLKSLPKPQQRQLLSLHNNFPGKHPFSGITKTNALPCGPTSNIGAIYPTICLLNHSCFPNAHNSWNSTTTRETIHAIRAIAAGDELTIAYDTALPSSPRRTHLENAFGFVCTCALCSLPPPALATSDARRLQIQRLDAAIGDPARVMGQPSACLADCHALLHVLEEEYGGAAVALFARLYYDAFQISITHGDQARAGVFAERGYRARVGCEGEDSPETLRVKRLVEDPARHGSFGASMRWKTAKGLVPEGLDAGALERWLWRLGG